MLRSELMPDDWVRNDLGEIQQVVELREKGAMLAYNDIYPYDKIEPVLITADILQANGFEKTPDWRNFGDLWVWKKDDSHTNIEILLLSEPIDGRSVLVRFLTDCKKGFGVNEFCSHDMTAIHELQHAFKLCGVDKNFSFDHGIRQSH